MFRLFLFPLLTLLTLTPHQCLASVFNEGTDEEILDHIDFLVEQKEPPSQSSQKELVSALQKTKNPVLIRERAAWAIGQLNLRKQSPALLEAAKSKSLLIRSAALDSLTRFRARQGLSTYINIAKNDPVFSMRQRATIALGLLRWKEAIKALVDLSSDPNDIIRGAATLGMAATHSKTNDFSDVMKEMLEDQSPFVQERAKKGMDVIQRKNIRVRDHFSSNDSDIRLFGALYFHYHGKPADLDTLKKKSSSERSEDVRYEMDLAIQAINKRIAKEKERKRAAAKRAAAKKAAAKKAAAEKAKKSKAATPKK